MLIYMCMYERISISCDKGLKNLWNKCCKIISKGKKNFKVNVTISKAQYGWLCE